MAEYSVNDRAVARVRRLIEARQYVLESDWGDSQPSAAVENRFLRSHRGTSTPSGTSASPRVLTDETKARYAFV